MSVEKFKKCVNKKAAYVLGGLIGMLVSIISMFVFAAIILIFNIDRTYSIPFSTISVAIGGFIASRLIAKKIGDRGYLIGIITGLLIFAFLLIISIISGGEISWNTFYRFIIILLSSLVGGIVGVNSNKPKKFI